MGQHKAARASRGERLALRRDDVSLPPYRGQLAVGLPHTRRRILLAIVLAVIWGAAVWVAQRIHLGPEVRQLALFVHLVALVLGFGAVLTADWFGLLWLGGRRSLAAVLQVVHATQVLIWAGLAGLLLSGVLLGPDTSSSLTRVKLVAMLVVALNGLYLGGLTRRLTAHAGNPRWPIMTRVTISLLISQCGWWVMMVIGYISTTRR